MAAAHAPADPPEERGSLAHDNDGADRSLIEDVQSLIGDGKGYLEAELSFQKARAGFFAGGLKRVALLGAVAAALVFFALIGLTVGLIIALTPLITALGATAVVVGVLLIGAVLAARSAGKHWQHMMAAAGSSPEVAP